MSPSVGIHQMALELAAIDREREAGAPPATVLERAERALDAANRLRVAEFVVRAATLVAALLADSGRMEEARRVVERYEPELGSRRNRPPAVALLGQHVRALVALARAEQDPTRARARWREVDRRAGEVIEIAEHHRHGVSSIEQLNASAGRSADVYAAGVEACLALGDRPGALRIAELVKCRSAHRLADARRSTDARLESELRALSDAAEAASLAGRPEPAEHRARRRELWARLQIERYAERAPVPPFDLRELQSRLPREMAVVSWFWLDPTRLLVAAFDGRELVTVVETFSTSEREAIDAQASAILQLRDLRCDSRSIELQPDLAARVLPAAIHDVLAGKRRLVFSPHRSLHALPLGLLRWTDGRPLARTFALSYAPNLTLLLRPLSIPDPSRSVLFVGVPKRARPDEARLRSVASEEKYVRECYDTERLVSCLPPRGTKAELDRWSASGELERFGTLHFACHGVNGAPDDPMASSLLLHDADADAYEITGWRLDADLVVLSACQSAQRPIAGRGLTEFPGDEIFGLTAAFIAAGARQVLGTLWVVDDSIAAMVCKLFHDNLRDAPPDVALSRALDTLLTLKPTCRKLPGLWASFFLTTVGLPPGSGETARPASHEDAPAAEHLVSFELVLKEGADREATEERLRERVSKQLEAALVLGLPRALGVAEPRAIEIAAVVREGSSPIPRALRQLIGRIQALAMETHAIEDVRVVTGARSFWLHELDEATVGEIAHSAESRGG